MPATPTTPRTWATSDVVTAAQLNSNLRDNIAFLLRPPGVRVVSSGVSVPTASATTFTWGAGITDGSLDPWSMWASGTGIVTIPTGCTGRYHVICTAAFAPNGAGTREVVVTRPLGGGSVAFASADGDSASSPSQYVTATDIAYLFAGDQIAASIVQTSGSTLSTFCTLSLAWVGQA